MAFIDKSSQYSLYKETTYGVAPTVDTDHAVELINPTFDAATAMVDREILRNSLVKAQSLLGEETSSGSCALELSSVNSTLGLTPVSPVAASAGTNVAGEITFTVAADADNYTVGQVIKATNPSGDVYVNVTAITAGVSLTVLPALVTNDYITFEGTIQLDNSVNGDLLYEAGIGNKILAVSTVAGTNLLGVITPTTGTDVDSFTVGQAVLCKGGAEGDVYGIVRSITASTSMVISPAPTGSDHTLFSGCLSYTIAKPDAETISLTVNEYMKSADSYVEYAYSGVAVTDVTFDFPLANIVKASFNLAGAGFETANGVLALDDRAPICFSESPYVAKNMSFLYDGVSYDIESLNVNIASDIYDTKALTTAGISNKTVTAKSNVGGSFSLEFGSTELFDKFQAGTTGEIFGTVSNATGTMGIYSPLVSLSSSSKSIDNGLYKETADFTSLSSESCSANVEDAITIFMA